MKNLSILDKLLKEIIIQNVGNAFQQVGIDGGVGIHFIQMVGCARNLAGEPNRGSALLLQHGLNPVPDMYLLDFRHKKCVELYFLLKFKGFHALPI